ncbi:MAG TPA: TIGR01777 family oxidoreductase [Flavobacterium sp.]|jgi:hypothetical protein
MRILVTGATGLVGSWLIKLLLQKRHSVHFLTTTEDKINSIPECRGFYWNPHKGEMDVNSLIGVDAVIHLAGASISKRWTARYKQEIIESRVLSANLLFRVLKNNPHQVKQFISASGIGIYRNSITNFYKEESREMSDCFLGNVVMKWEHGANQFRRIGINVCILRTGLVLSNKGGALPQMVKPVSLGFGSAFGSGKQVVSWIHVADLAAMYVFALENSLDGVYNAVAPEPVSNKVLTKEIARTLHKPLFMPNVPKFLMEFTLGEMHKLLFDSQYVDSSKIIREGFLFSYPDIRSALTEVLNKKAPSKTELS